MSEDHKKKRKFLNLPQYPGGASAFKAFVADNLRYPQEAQNKKTEGSVVVGYDISDEGIVINPKVLKGIGHGCDEEAVRVVGLLRYEKVRNRGVRVKVTTKTTIHFKLNEQGMQINYTMATKSPPEEKKIEGTGSYEYTIKW